MDLHLEAEHEVQGEDVDCHQFKPGLYVCGPILCFPSMKLTSFVRACACGIIRTIDLGGLSSSNYTGKTPLPLHHVT
jgi:hypothetical protein